MERSSKRIFQELSAGALRDIGMGEFGLAFDDKPLVTLAASTCIVVAAHNSRTGFRMLGHFSDIVGGSNYSNGTEFEVAIQALQDLGDPSHTEIELHGGSPFIVNDHDTVEADRTRAIQSLTDSYPQSKLTEFWLAENQCVDVSVEHNGEILAFIYPK